MTTNEEIGQAYGKAVDLMSDADLEFEVSMLVEKYGQRRDPNNRTIQLQAPIDIYDAAKLVYRLYRANKRLVFELENARDKRESGVQNDGSQP